MKKENTKNKEKNTKKVTKKEVKKDKKKTNLFKDIKKEMSKVHFPGKKEMITYSIATISFVIFFGIYFYLINLLMAFLKSII